MALTVLHIKDILVTGTSMTISSVGKTALHLKELAITAATHGSTLTITDCDRLTALQLKDIGIAGKKHVHLIL